MKYKVNITAKRRVEMLDLLIGGIVAVLLLVFLVWCLLNAEDL